MSIPHFSKNIMRNGRLGDALFNTIRNVTR